MTSPHDWPEDAGQENSNYECICAHCGTHFTGHSAAVWLAEDGHSMDEIAQFLGHSNSAITAKVYSRYSPGYLRKLAASLEI